MSTTIESLEAKAPQGTYKRLAHIPEGKLGNERTKVEVRVGSASMEAPTLIVGIKVHETGKPFPVNPHVWHNFYIDPDENVLIVRAARFRNAYSEVEVYLIPLPLPKLLRYVEFASRRYAKLTR